MEKRIGEVTGEIFTSDGPTVAAFRACCRIREFCRTAGIAIEEEQEAVRAVWIEHNPDEHPEPQQQWAATVLENLREQYRAQQKAARADSGGDQPGHRGDQEHMDTFGPSEQNESGSTEDTSNYSGSG